MEAGRIVNRIAALSVTSTDATSDKLQPASKPAGGGSSGSGAIPPNDGGDHDGDNNGGPSDGDGNSLTVADSKGRAPCTYGGTG